MRLKERHQSAVGVNLPGRGQRGGELRRMMRIVIDDENTAARPFCFEASDHAREFREGPRDRGKWNRQLPSHGDRGKRVLDVVPPRQAQADGTETPGPPFPNLERRAGRLEPNLSRAKSG